MAFKNRNKSEKLGKSIVRVIKKSFKIEIVKKRLTEEEK